MRTRPGFSFAGRKNGLFVDSFAIIILEEGIEFPICD